MKIQTHLKQSEISLRQTLCTCVDSLTRCKALGEGVSEAKKFPYLQNQEMTSFIAENSSNTLEIVVTNSGSNSMQLYTKFCFKRRCHLYVETTERSLVEQKYVINHQFIHNYQLSNGDTKTTYLLKNEDQNFSILSHP